MIDWNAIRSGAMPDNMPDRFFDGPLDRSSDYPRSIHISAIQPIFAALIAHIEELEARLEALEHPITQTMPPIIPVPPFVIFPIPKEKITLQCEKQSDGTLVCVEPSANHTAGDPFAGVALTFSLAVTCLVSAFIKLKGW